MTSTKHYRTILTVRLLSKSERGNEFTVFSNTSKTAVTLKEDEEFLGNWRSANPGTEVDISVTTLTANTRGLVGYLSSGGTSGGTVNG